MMGWLRSCDRCGEAYISDVITRLGGSFCGDCAVRVDKTRPSSLGQHSHYKRDITHLKTLDWYRACELFGQTDQALSHAGKKIMFAGIRGAKNKRKDIQEAIDTLTRRLEMLGEDERAEGGS